MEPLSQIQNPFKPTAGKMPPELIGRDEAIGEFYNGLLNGAGAPERLLRVTGARGMGKTVLLGEYRRIVNSWNPKWTVLSETAEPGFCERILTTLAAKRKSADIHIEPSALSVSIGSLDIKKASLGLRDTMMKTTEKGNGLFITLDEVQDATIDEMRALAVAVQHLITEDRNVAFAFAGLPSLVGNVLDGEAMTFLRRAMPIKLDRLENPDVASSLEDTMSRIGHMEISKKLVSELAEASEGYPFMVQLTGYYTWQHAHSRLRGVGVINEEDVEAGIKRSKSRFFETVIEPALQHLPISSMNYLLAMAQDEGSSQTAQVAERIGSSQTSASSVRDKLIREGLIDAPKRGYVQFAIPYLGDYLRTLHERD